MDACVNCEQFLIKKLLVRKLNLTDFLTKEELSL